MERLTLEDLARLVDEHPTPQEQAALDADPRLQSELGALRSQTEELRTLPAVLPAPDGWEELEEKLLAAGLLQGQQLFAPPVWRRWMQGAAAVVIFVAGTAFGWIANTTPGGTQDEAGAQDGPATYASADEARHAVEDAKRRWQEAYLAYNELSGPAEGRPAPRDPLQQLAALEALMAATRVAVEEFPEDQFFNGVYVQAQAEQRRAVRRFTLDSWH